jgi:hypothetical protein
LLDAAKAWARDHGAARLELESGAARVDAHRFYEREGPDGWSRSFRWSLERSAGASKFPHGREFESRPRCVELSAPPLC